jgi:DNA invertase Pin-like site-specific DNA recombinase
MVPLTSPQRCAIYTRKSAQPPIAQEFTSIESQRAICASYIASQQHKGWLEIDKPYDDSGRSGSNLDRPALQDLLDDIEQGLVDVVLVYKMDRITRTLLDFVRLIDFFERYGVTFVAITQNFDTSDSMGRLIRNVLLTFAQFEREIASDRMRDKKMMMKKRGMWTGGNAPIGYDLKRGRLVVNAAEERIVRCIFETFVETASIASAHRRIEALGYRRKSWRAKNGVQMGGGPIPLTSIHHVLQNPVYAGDVTYRGERCPGIHQPIVEAGLWERAQTLLAARQPRQGPHVHNLLTGLLFDDHGRRMNAREHKAPRYPSRYYESALMSWAVRQDLKKARVRADDIERLVLTNIAELFRDRPQLRLLLMRIGILGPVNDRLTALGPAAAVLLWRLQPGQLSAALKALVSRVELGAHVVRLLLRPGVLARFLQWDGRGIFRIDELDRAHSSDVHFIEIPASLTTLRRKPYIPVSPRRTAGSSPNGSLVRLLKQARDAQALVFAERDRTLPELARSQNMKAAGFSRLVRLNYLAPDIVAAILDGEQPDGLTRKQLLRFDLPIDWKLQRALLGFAQRPELETCGPARPASQEEPGPSR